MRIKDLCVAFGCVACIFVMDNVEGTASAQAVAAKKATALQKDIGTLKEGNAILKGKSEEHGEAITNIKSKLASQNEVAAEKQGNITELADLFNAFKAEERESDELKEAKLAEQAEAIALLQGTVNDFIAEERESHRLKKEKLEELQMNSEAKSRKLIEIREVLKTLSDTTTSLCEKGEIEEAKRNIKSGLIDIITLMGVEGEQFEEMEPEIQVVFVEFVLAGKTDDLIAMRKKAVEEHFDINNFSEYIEKFRKEALRLIAAHTKEVAPEALAEDAIVEDVADEASLVEEDLVTEAAPEADSEIEAEVATELEEHDEGSIYDDFANYEEVAVE